MSLSKTPSFEIYIGGIESLDLALENEITHVISLIPGKLPGSFRPSDFVKHLHIEIDDDEKADIMQYFQETNEFISKALESKNNKVLVHCVAGMSRSVTIVVAYIAKQTKQSINEVLEHEIAPARGGTAIPNEGFLEQLELYSECGYNISDAEPRYRQWRLANGLTPKYVSAIPTQKTESLLRCKKCRVPLASSSGFILHEPSTKNSYSKDTFGTETPTLTGSSLPFSCNQYFMEPVLWMKPELERGELEGKFQCPKCSAKVGSYSWQGGKCSCGKWITPAIELQKAKVDEVRRAF